MDDNSLSIDEIRSICYDILYSEVSKYNLSVNLYPVTIVEYYRDYIFKKKFSLVRNYRDIGAPVFSWGYYNDIRGDLVIFLNHIYNIRNNDRAMFELVFICFHEIRHCIQDNFDIYSYEGFLRIMDEYLSNIFDINYRNYSFEIGADLYGIINAREYLENNYLDIYNRNKEIIDNLYGSYIFNYMMYDVFGRIDRIIYDYRNILKKDKKLFSFVDIFLGSGGEVRELRDIISDDRLGLLDNRIVYSFLSCNYFLSNIDINLLSSDDVSILSSSLDYAKEICLNQIKYINDLISKKEGSYYNNELNSLYNRLGVINEFEAKLLDSRDMVGSR